MATTNPTQFTWVDPTTDTDGNPLQPNGITGYQIGVRPKGTGTAGTYTVTVQIADPKAVAEPIAALGTVLIPGIYDAAIKALGPQGSDYGPETEWTVQPTKSNPPTGFKVG